MRKILSAHDVASVLVWGETAEGNDYLTRAKALIPIIQEHGAAALLRGELQFVARADADGFHSDTTAEDLKIAATQFAKQRIIGAAKLKERHDAMVAGETGVDYVFFGDPRFETPHDLLAERCEWWQSLFSVPCVAYAEDTAQAIALAQAGADFIAPGKYLWAEPDPLQTLAILEIEFSKL